MLLVGSPTLYQRLPSLEEKPYIEQRSNYVVANRILVNILRTSTIMVDFYWHGVSFTFIQGSSHRLHQDDLTSCKTVLNSVVGII